MTSQQPPSPGHDPRDTDLFQPAPIDQAGSEMHLDTHTPAFGDRLRAARDSRGLSLESCAHALKLPVRVLRQLESDRHDAIDYQVYLGSYISKYGRHLGLGEDEIRAELSRLKHKGEPELVATGGISHSRYLLERYATAATYVVLTAVIVVPMIWLGVRGTLNRDISHLAPLDASPVAQQDLPSSTTSTATAVALSAPKVALPRTAADDQPLLASMVPNMSAEPLKPQPPVMAAADAGTGGHTVELSLADPSWVEITAADGSRLEYGLLPAGSQKTYHSDQPLDVRLGNATGAKVMLDGKPLALDAYRHANVAHFRVAMENGQAVPHAN